MKKQAVQLRASKAMSEQWCIDVDDQLRLHPTQLSRRSNKEEIEKIVKRHNSHEDLINILREAYLNLQRASNYKVSIAIATDSFRATLRNKLSELTGTDCEDLQNEVEYEALNKRIDF